MAWRCQFRPPQPPAKPPEYLLSQFGLAIDDLVLASRWPAPWLLAHSCVVVRSPCGCAVAVLALFFGLVASCWFCLPSFFALTCHSGSSAFGAAHFFKVKNRCVHGVLYATYGWAGTNTP